MSRTTTNENAASAAPDRPARPGGVVLGRERDAEQDRAADRSRATAAAMPERRRGGPERAGEGAGGDREADPLTGCEEEVHRRRRVPGRECRRLLALSRTAGLAAAAGELHRHGARRVRDVELGVAARASPGAATRRPASSGSRRSSSSPSRSGFGSPGSAPAPAALGVGGSAPRLPGGRRRRAGLRSAPGLRIGPAEAVRDRVDLAQRRLAGARRAAAGPRASRRGRRRSRAREVHRRVDDVADVRRVAVDLAVAEEVGGRRVLVVDREREVVGGEKTSKA